MSEEHEREVLRDKEGGFTVRDRRVFSEDAEREADAAAPEEAKASEPPAEPLADAPPQADASPPPLLPEIDFSTFLVSMSTTAMYHLGVIPDPDTQKPKMNLPLAKQTIDLLSMLRTKSEGNRSVDESKLLDGLLYDLRMRYIDALSKPQPRP